MLFQLVNFWNINYLISSNEDLGLKTPINLNIKSLIK